MIRFPQGLPKNHKSSAPSWLDVSQTPIPFIQSLYPLPNGESHWVLFSLFSGFFSSPNHLTCCYTHRNPCGLQRPRNFFSSSSTHSPSQENGSRILLDKRRCGYTDDTQHHHRTHITLDANLVRTEKPRIEMQLSKPRLMFPYSYNYYASASCTSCRAVVLFVLALAGAKIGRREKVLHSSSFIRGPCISLRSR